jgi:hypothetical protein
MQKEYFIVHRGSSGWWVISAGTSLGPYLSQEVAQAAGLDLAKADASNRIHAKVYVELNMWSGMTLVYDSTANSERSGL